MEDSRVFSGIMDQESADWSVATENTRYVLNLVNVQNKYQGSWTNIQSSLEVINPYLKLGTNKCIGTFEDVRDGSIIFCVYNSLGYHGIFRWYSNVSGASSGVIEKVYQVATPTAYNQYNENPLGWSDSSFITGINLVDDLFFITDYNKSPKCINAKRANLTNKRKEYNLYFNPEVIPTTGGCAFNISTYTLGSAVPTYQIAWVTINPTIQDIIADAMTAFNNSAMGNAAKFEDMGNYIHVTLLQGGEQYHIGITYSSSIWGGILVADNFYPDTIALPQSYSAMNYQLIERVKYPPKCPPVGRFTSSGTEGLFNAQIANVVLQNTQQPSVTSYYTWYNYSGLSVISDPVGFINAGGTNQQGPFSPGGPYSVFAGFIKNILPTPITVLFTVELSVTVTGFANGFTPINPSWIFYLSTQTNASIPPSNAQQLWAWTPAYGGGQTYGITVTIQRTIASGEEVGLFSTNAGIAGSYTGTIFGAVLTPGYNNWLADTYPRFRAKYIYKDGQQSVYGAISDTVVPVSAGQNEILVNYNDPRLEDVSLVSDIKNVVLAVSKDNGNTWYDFATLEQWEFAGPDRQKYTYRGTEALIPVSTSEAILQYHDVPLLSKGQEYVDDRIWDGGIVRGYDKVPLKLELSVGYRPLIYDPLYSFTQIEPPASISYWRRGWRGHIGVVYYDDADRKSAVCIDENNSLVEVPYYTDNGSLDPAYLVANITSIPPEWATKYRFVRTQDMSQSSYLIWCADELKFVNLDDSEVLTAPSPNTRYIRIGLNNFDFYVNNINKGAKIDFTYVDGDRLRFIMDINGDYFQSNDYPILKVDTTYVYIQYDGSIGSTGSLPTLTDGAILEFYSPRPQVEKPLYYEFGPCYDIEAIKDKGITKKRHCGGVQNQLWPESPYYLNTWLPAVSELDAGDVWYRNRTFYANTVAIPGFVENTFFISSSTTSDFTDQDFDNNGRTNATDIIGRQHDDSGICFSDQYVTGTQINGLNAVQPANNKKFSTTYGLVNKLQVINNDILRIIFGNGYQLSIYVNQGVIRQAQGASSIISVLNEVAANSHMIQRTWGTTNPESVVINDEGDVMGYDEIEGLCWMSAGNGTVDISNYLMSSTWHGYGEYRRQLNVKRSFVPSVYDLERDLFVISLNALAPQQEVLPSANIKLPDFDNIIPTIDIRVAPNNTILFSAPTAFTSWRDILNLTGWATNVNADGSVDIFAPSLFGYENSSIVIQVTYLGLKYIFNYPLTGGVFGGENAPFSPVTLAYSKNRRGWTNYFSFNPEYYGRLRNQIVGFVDGKMHLHGAGSGFNNFYGVQYGSILRYQANKDYPKVKTMNAIWYRGKGAWGAKMYNPSSASYPWGQETEMTPLHFELQEDGYYSRVLKNKLDPRYPTTDQAWVNGEDISGDATLVELYNDETTDSRLDTVKTLYLYSENS